MATDYVALLGPAQHLDARAKSLVLAALVVGIALSKGKCIGFGFWEGGSWGETAMVIRPIFPHALGIVSFSQDCYWGDEGGAWALGRISTLSAAESLLIFLLSRNELLVSLKSFTFLPKSLR